MVREAASRISSALSDIVAEKVIPTLVVTLLVAGVGFGYNAGSNADLALERITNHASQMKSLESAIIGLSGTLAQVSIDLAVIQSWRNSDFFTGDRFTLDMGKAEIQSRKSQYNYLSGEISSCREDIEKLKKEVIAHDKESERYKQKIDTALVDIKELARTCREVQARANKTKTAAAYD